MKLKCWLAAGAALGLTVFGLGGCCPVTPETGLLVTVASYPHVGQACTDGTLGQRTGESSVFTILYLVTVGDASVERAARSSGITKIKTIDHKYLNVLGLFSQYTTVVSGD